MTEQINPAIDFAQKLFKSLVWDTLLEVGLAALFLEAPYLAVPPIKQIITGVAGLASDAMFKVYKLTVDVAAVPLINEAHRKAFDRAAVTLAIIARNKGIDSDEFKKARDNAKDALRTFVRVNA